MVELLSPAGDFTSLSAVLKNGADAVYIGLDGVNMRINASNFKLDQIKKASQMAKEYNAKLYVCTNTIMRDKDVERLNKQLPVLADSGVDGLIISDIGLIESTCDYGMEAHISVQENITNLNTLKTLKKLGAKRAILSRELSLRDIRNITKKSPIETEVFIHGAMCMAISGRCFLSYGLYGRSANCGDCLQPCRKNWKLSFDFDNNDKVINSSDLKMDEESFLIGEAYDNTYRTTFFSPKDMAMIEHIPELMESGVDAFKIEGRARSADYAATATNVYRQAIDLYNKDKENYKYNPKWMEQLQEVFNRGFDTGFYFNTPYEISENNKSEYVKKDIGKVLNYYNKPKVAEIKIWDDLSLGDELMVQGPTTGSVRYTVNSMEIENRRIEKACKGQDVGVYFPEKLRKNDFVYKLVKREDFEN
ncbi:peptidase U32 family protein [Methanobrevibacter boviskoreani]|uniref:peptidase U32 family protein n=1 Tax=Methanobrevibacter boviskoreani TaxID=1348249 RepID=UPI0023F42AED|nr:peptidase U32 family protein [Methanobrevibacter boviskoreani]MDD6256712.1 U32 family peptidase [Methanobrevibacter boviskoreani]